MARPAAEIIKQIELGTGQQWQILKAQAYFVITYKDEPIALRTVTYGIEGANYKYKKLTYTNLGNALAQVRTLNHRFGCEDFDVLEVYT